jgi:nicotinamide-nucleotide amidase
MKAEIIAIGSEMLTPFRQDTNSLYLTQKFNELGVTVAFKSIVGDRLRDLVSAIRTALGRTDIVAIMGGLGPTEDDLTREAVAEALGLRLHRDGAIIAALHARAAQLRRALPDNNLKQGDVIDGAIVLENPNGTAPGQWLDVTYDGFRKLLFLVPGPPGECKPLFDKEVTPRLRAVLPIRHIATRTMKAAMIPESQADALLAPIYTTYPDIETTILAHAGDIQLTLLCGKPTRDEAEARVEELASKMEEVLEDWLYTSEGETLEQTIIDFLGFRQATLSVAESCTGGMVSERLTRVSGSSRAFLGGAVVYSNDLKTAFAGVPAGLILTHGAVSAEVASALAEGIRQRTRSTYGLGITGVAGPTGGSEEKPVGTVFIALSDGKRTEVRECHFLGERQRIREWSTQQALDIIRRRLR